MIHLDKFIDLEPFSLREKEKNKIFSEQIIYLTKFHYKNCFEYKKIINFLKFNFKKKYQKEDMPFIPVRLFKDYDLLSVEKKNIFKVLTSSGTTGKKLSKIYLDRSNALIQKKVLSKIMSSFIGSERLPLLIIDSKSIFKDRNLFSARATAILGFSIFGYDHTYALNEDLSLNIKNILNFYKKYKNKKFLVFGFTSLIWEKLCIELKKKNIFLNFNKAIILHGGGWKKLENKNISNVKFKKKLKENLNVNKIHNYYGMAEQTGSIFLECEKCGYFITSIFSDILIRDRNFNLVKRGKKGFVQLLSVLPTSYPGHNILTEDIGEIAKETSNCTCSIYGKRFKIYGRVSNAETRGCSDI